MTLIESGHRRISTVLDLTRVQVLGLVAARGPLRPSEIARGLGMTKSAVSRHLTALQEAGQIQVDDDPSDARTFLVAATDDGRRETQRTVDAGTVQFARAIAQWSDLEVENARKAVERLLGAWASAASPDRTQERTQPSPRPRWTRRRRPEDGQPC